MQHLSPDQINLIIEEKEITSQEILDHLTICEKCALTYESELALHNELLKLEYHKPSMRFAKNVYELIQKNKSLNKASIFWIRVINFSILGAISLAFVMLIYLFIETSALFTLEENNISTLFRWSVISLFTVSSFWLLYFIERLYVRKDY